MGTGRSPISDCASLIHDAIDTTSMATIGAGRDMRLTLISQMFAATQYGLSIHLRSAEEIGVFYKEVLDFLMRMDVIERLIYPLPGMQPPSFTFESLTLNPDTSPSRARGLLLHDVAGLLSVLQAVGPGTCPDGNEDCDFQVRPAKPVVPRCRT